MTSTAPERVLDAHDVAVRTERAVRRAWEALVAVRELGELDPVLRETVDHRLRRGGYVVGLERECARLTSS